MSSTKKVHHHIVRQSLIQEATIWGVKVGWVGYLGLAGMILFPLSGGGITGIGLLVFFLWLIKKYLLEPIYQYDKDAIEIFASTLFGLVNFYQSHADINSPRGSASRSRPKPGK